MLGQLRDLLLPRGCAGCDVPDQVLCVDCRACFRGCRRRSLPGSLSGSSFSCAAYRDTARHAILMWKDHGDEECDDPFSGLLADLAIRTGVVGIGRRTLLVPAPSSRASMRARGRWHMRTLAERTGRTLRRRGYDVSVAPVLRTANISSKSVEAATALQRSSRINGNIRCVDRHGCAGYDVIIVDDIITTGATMRQCVAVLNAASARVVAALSLACTEE